MVGFLRTSYSDGHEAYLPLGGFRVQIYENLGGVSYGNGFLVVGLHQMYIPMALGREISGRTAVT